MTADTAIRLVLEHLQSVLRDLHRAATEHAVRFGTPPPELIVEMREASDHRSFNTGATVARWRVSVDEVAPQDLGPLSPPTRAAGMYHESGRADFAIRPDHTSVRIGWQVGPRFGRGYDADLETHEDGHVALGAPRPIWAS